MYRVLRGDVLSFARHYKGSLFHAIFCDPPYHLTSITKRFSKTDSKPAQYGKDGVYQRASKGFMGKVWDGFDEKGTGISFRPETWEALAKLLYPGAFLIAFASARGWHRQAVAMEDAGLIMHPSIFGWAYGSGFPKATRVKGNKEFDGHRYGLQALKPAVEPLLLFSKSKDMCYTDLQEQLDLTSRFLEELWNIQVTNQNETASAAHGVNTILLKVLGWQDQNYKVSGFTAGDVAKQPIKPKEFLDTTAVKGGATVQKNVIDGTEQNSPTEVVPNAGIDSKHATLFETENIVVEPVPMPQDDAPCWKTPCELGIDTDTLVDILQSNLERGRLDSSTTWLWRLILADLYNVANKSTIETAKKMTIELRILNYLLHKLTQASIQSERNLHGERLFYARDVATNFIGLLMFLKEHWPIAHHVSLEPILVMQKPYEGRPVDSITETGAGTLWIDGARIGTSELSGKVYNNRLRHGDDIYGGGDGIPQVTLQGNDNGRWPANFCLIHSPDCKIIGERKPEGYTINRFTDGMKPFGNDAGHEYESEEMSSGIEPVYECVPECPIRRLDEQSGKCRSAGEYHKGAIKTGDKSGPASIPINGLTSSTYADSGGASRFFHRASWNFENTDPVLYVAKASRRERDAGLEDMPVTKKPRLEGDTRPNHIEDGLAFDGKEQAVVRNGHPAIKPIELTKWLATLLLPPKEYSPRRILIPFAGTGSEMIGSCLVGWDEVIGVEGEKEYVNLANARLKHWISQDEQLALEI